MMHALSTGVGGYFYTQYYSSSNCMGSILNSYGYALNQCYIKLDSHGNTIGSILFSCSGQTASYRQYSSYNCSISSEITIQNATLSNCTSPNVFGSLSSSAVSSKSMCSFTNNIPPLTTTGVLYSGFSSTSSCQNQSPYYFEIYTSGSCFYDKSTATARKFSISSPNVNVLTFGDKNCLRLLSQTLLNNTRLGSCTTSGSNCVPWMQPLFETTESQYSNNDRKLWVVLTAPTAHPTELPTEMPTEMPTYLPTHFPTELPTNDPTSVPSSSSVAVSIPTPSPTGKPTTSPASVPSHLPTAVPTTTIHSPSQSPTPSPTTTSPISSITTTPMSPTLSVVPSLAPSVVPSRRPSTAPSTSPTCMPTTLTTTTPVSLPSPLPTYSPATTSTHSPSPRPTLLPTPSPTLSPNNIVPSTLPSRTPTSNPSALPTNSITAAPSTSPTRLPTAAPTTRPTQIPSQRSSVAPSAYPSAAPSAVTPSSAPTSTSTILTTASPTVEGYIGCSAVTRVSILPAGTRTPSTAPSAAPSAIKTASPTAAPSATRTSLPTAIPSSIPTATFTATPTRTPSGAPTATLTRKPTAAPTRCPTTIPGSPTQLPTVATVVNLKASVGLSNINSTQFKSDGSSSQALQETVAAVINGTSPSAVTITSVVDAPATGRRLGVSGFNVAPDERALAISSSSSVVVSFTVNFVTGKYASSSTAYQSVSSALSASVTSGQFNKQLSTNAAYAGATALKSAVAIPSSVVVVNLITSSPTKSPQQAPPVLLPVNTPSSSSARPTAASGGTELFTNLVIGGIAVLGFFAVLLCVFICMRCGYCGARASGGIDSKPSHHQQLPKDEVEGPLHQDLPDDDDDDDSDDPHFSVINVVVEDTHHRL